MLVEVKETIQAGDNFLIKFDCKQCLAENLNHWQNLTCCNCKTINGLCFEFENTKKKFRCLAGTVKKKLRLSKRLVRTLMEIHQGICAYCDVKFDEFHIDHVVPVSFGGSNNINNLVLSCKNCNWSAGSKVFPSFADKKLWIIKHRKFT